MLLLLLPNFLLFVLLYHTICLCLFCLNESSAFVFPVNLMPVVELPTVSILTADAVAKQR